MKAPQFDLMGVDGKRYSPITARGDKGLLVMFICNHCPYVKRAIDRIVRDCKELAPLGIGSIAVMSNDPADYPEDSFDNMKRVARERLSLSLRHRRDAGCRARVRRGMHAGVLRLRRRARAAVPRPGGRAVRRHVGDR